MNYDDWKSTEPDEPWKQPHRCETPNCLNDVTFPSWEVFCTPCLVERERQRQILERQLALRENQVRR